jgi:hypothetical protein
MVKAPRFSPKMSLPRDRRAEAPHLEKLRPNDAGVSADGRTSRACRGQAGSHLEKAAISPLLGTKTGLTRRK